MIGSSRNGDVSRPGKIRRAVGMQMAAILVNTWYVDGWMNEWADGWAFGWMDG